MPDHPQYGREASAHTLRRSGTLRRNKTCRNRSAYEKEKTGVSGCCAAEGRRSLRTVIDGPRGMCVHHG